MSVSDCIEKKGETTKPILVTPEGLRRDPFVKMKDIEKKSQYQNPTNHKDK